MLVWLVCAAVADVAAAIAVFAISAVVSAVISVAVAAAAAVAPAVAFLLLLWLLCVFVGLEVQRGDGPDLHVLRHDADELGGHQHRWRIERSQERMDGHVAHHHGAVGLLHPLRLDAHRTPPFPRPRLFLTPPRK